MFTAFLDANVLVPVHLCDTLLDYLERADVAEFVADYRSRSSG